MSAGCGWNRGRYSDAIPLQARPPAARQQGAIHKQSRHRFYYLEAVKGTATIHRADHKLRKCAR